jgi:spore germination cell wall hydrolase CwlJ-like protein
MTTEITLSDHKFYLAVNNYHEARGESIEGQIAIGHIVINRCQKNGTTVKDVILKPWQFSWHNHDSYPPIEEYEAFRSCLNVADMIINERLSGKDLWKADHYFNPSVVLPSWASKMKFIKRIGNHDFYKE